MFLDSSDQALWSMYKAKIKAYIKAKIIELYYLSFSYTKSKIIKQEWLRTNLANSGLVSSDEIIKRNSDFIENLLQSADIDYSYFRHVDKVRFCVKSDDTEAVLKLLAKSEALIFISLGIKIDSFDEPVRLKSFPAYLLKAEHIKKISRLCSFINITRYTSLGPGARTLLGEKLSCHVEFWQKTKGDTYQRTVWNNFQTTLNSDEFSKNEEYIQALSQIEGQRNNQILHSDVANFPIDLVYTWVDGSDPVWQERKKHALKKYNYDLPDISIGSSRYISNDELLYSLRSVETYAAYIRKIFIVTDNQIPDWLNAAHPKVKIIDHTEIFEDESDLPTFNSHAIEANIHRIPGLSEHFVYLNDDMFFGNHSTPADFFTAGGLPKFFYSKSTYIPSHPSKKILPIDSAAIVARSLIYRKFNKIITRKFYHTGYSLRKSILYQIEEQFKKELLDTSSSRFRAPTDVSLPACLHHHYAYQIGAAIPTKIKYGYFDSSKKKSLRELQQMLVLSENERYTMFCVNDMNLDDEKRKKHYDIVDQVLREYFPYKSSFEL